MKNQSDLCAKYAKVLAKCERWGRSSIFAKASVDGGSSEGEFAFALQIFFKIARIDNHNGLQIHK